MPLPCGENVGRSGASWHAAQRLGHVFDRPASVSSIRGGSRFGGIQTSGYGLGLPTLLLGVGSGGDNRGLNWLIFGVVEVPAFDSLEVPIVSDRTSGYVAGRLLTGTDGPSGF